MLKYKKISTFVRCGIKMKSLFRVLAVLILCLSVLFTFTACKDDEIYAGSDDFESYPDYWNGFNEDSGDIYLPDTNSTASGTAQGSGDSDDSNVSSDDYTANFTDDEDDTESKVESKVEETTSSKVDDSTDTDNDGTPDVDDTDDDNDGITDDKDPDDDNDGTTDDEEKPDYGNQGPLVFF